MNDIDRLTKKIVELDSRLVELENRAMLLDKVYREGRENELVKVSGVPYTVARKDVYKYLNSEYNPC